MTLIRYSDPMTVPTPATLRHQAKPFDDPDWVFELKHDGFRALAVLKGGKVRFVSRTGRQLHGFGSLAENIASEVRAESAIVDGEIAVPHKTGRTLFARLMEQREEPAFMRLTCFGSMARTCRLSPY